MFEEICKKILSPPKFRYSLYDLGSTITKFGKRTDFVVYNYKNKKMNCSFYQPHDILYQRACVIYLHSMNGSRLQSSIYVQSILKLGVSFCSFDFSGCGNSEGDTISFGANQKYDIEAVVSRLKSNFYLNKFILWGRSMGSVSAIKYCQLIYEKSKNTYFHQKQQIFGLILDSSFKSLSKLLVQVGSSQAEIPQILVKAGYLIIKNSLQQHGQFQISDLDLLQQQALNKQKQIKSPLDKLKASNIPILFLASKEDRTVSCQHSIDMFEAYKQNIKQLKFFKGLHNQSRDQDYITQVKLFISNLFNKKYQISSSENILVRNNSEPLLIKNVNKNNSNISSETVKTSQKEKQFNDNKKDLKKISILKLIEDKQAQHEKEEQTLQSLNYFQSFEPSCSCSMFQNELASSKQDRKKIINEQIPSFETQNRIPKINQSQTMNVKRSISGNYTQNNQKTARFFGHNFGEGNENIYTSNLTMTSRKTINYIKPIEGQRQVLEQQINENDNFRKKSTQSNEVFQQLYIPLKVKSQTSLMSPRNFYVAK